MYKVWVYVFMTGTHLSRNTRRDCPWRLQHRWLSPCGSRYQLHPSRGERYPSSTCRSDVGRWYPVHQSPHIVIYLQNYNSAHKERRHDY